MKLTDARIGYAGYSPHLTGPGDRRRFCSYARHRHIDYEPANLAREYDLVVVTHNGDVAGWTKRKLQQGERLRCVFELVDSYLTHRGLVRRLAKGTARYALGIDSRLSSDFLRTLERACSVADAVICSTEQQRAAILQYNKNVVVSFDHFDDDVGLPKSRYERGGKLKIVWEGQSATLPNLQLIRDPLNRLKNEVELHVITDPLAYRYFGRFFARKSTDFLRGFECDVHFHDWDIANFAALVRSADMAVIPIDPADPFAMGKPENKLVMMWRLGMPTATSPTPAYLQAMREAGIDMTCATPLQWANALERLAAASESELRSIGQQCRAYAEKAYSTAEFLSRFDQAFEAAGLSVS